MPPAGDVDIQRPACDIVHHQEETPTVAAAIQNRDDVRMLQGSKDVHLALETGPFEDYPESAWRAMLDSHLTTALVASQTFIAAFKRARASRAPRPE